METFNSHTLRARLVIGRDRAMVNRQSRGETIMTLHDAGQRALRQYIEAIERLNEEKKAIAADIAEKFSEAKGAGFDPKIMRQVIRLRTKTQDERDEADALLDTYLHALESFDATSMGEYLKEAAE